MAARECKTTSGIRMDMDTGKALQRQDGSFESLGSFGSSGCGLEGAAIHRNLKNSLLFHSPRPLEHFHSPGSASAQSLSETLLPGLDESAAGSLSTLSAALSIGSALLGTGLSVPYAFVRAGNSISLIVLALVACINSIGVRCVAQALESKTCVDVASFEMVPVQNRELSFLAFCAFQQKGRVFASIVLSMELWCALLVNFVSIGIHGSLLSQGILSQTTVIILTAAALFPLLEAPAWLLGGAGTLCLACVAVCLAVLAMAAGESPPPDSLGSSASAPGLLQVVSTAGVFFYNYGNAACLPMIKGEMAHSHAFEPVARLALAGSCLFYATLGLLGAKFGDNIGQSYLQNIDKSLPSVVACSAVVISMFLILPLLTKPILLATLPLVDAKTETRLLLFKLCFLCLSAFVAICLQDELAAVSAFTGASLTTSTCVLIPIAVYWKLCSPSMIQQCLLAVLFAFGIIFSVAGTISSVLDMWSGNVSG
eukprot:TRINITY_DN93097_c0_g1_i1.p1 TRINITY_DN93097_c0_g1~~TRINITY_DN93097_c0_g1_i1.p1  ORF type:complete len:492 (+),score=52.64 TRINITY_DN93097_c0_g1_i1:30-1478(+)